MVYMFDDLRFGVRMLRKRPGTSALAVVALAVGIGLTTTMFSIVQGVFLRGLPFDDADRLVAVTTEQGSGQRGPIRVVDYLDLEDMQRAFEGMAAFRTQTASVAGDFAAERARLVEMTPNTLGLLRVAPIAGRDFTAADGRPGAARVAIISHRLWTSAFNRETSAVGRVIRVNGVPTTVVGVAPERFGFPVAQDLWMPLALTRPETPSDAATVEAIARLRSGTPIEATRAELSAIARRLAEHSDNRPPGAAAAAPAPPTLDAQPYIRRFLGREVIDALTAMLGAVFGVMLIACANVANLQLARAAERTREVAVRTALGAGRGRIVRQLLIEGVLLAGVGAALGVALAAVGTTLFTRAIADTTPPFWIDIRLDTTVLVVVIGLTAVAAIVASLAPALRATRLDTNAVLKDEGRGATGLRLGRFGRSLVLAEIVVSCCLLVVSGFMLRSIMSATDGSYPYETARVFAASFAANGARYAAPENRQRLAEEVEAAVGAVPGVIRASVSTGAPESGCCGRRIAVDGLTYPTPDDRPAIRYRVVTPSYFDVLGIRPLIGRTLSASDRASSEPVVVLSVDLAARLFGDANPIGRRVTVDDGATPAWRTVVGIVPRLVEPGPGGGPSAIAFAPLAQTNELPFVVLASTNREPLSVASGVRSALAAIDADLAVFGVKTLSDLYYDQQWAIRVFGTLFMAFGAAALMLAMAGLYGVMAFNVRQRAPEIGVRMALGATRGTVVRMVLWQGMWRVVVGVVMGFLPAWWLGSLLGTGAFNLSVDDVVVYAVAGGAIIAVGAAATLVPARRAAALDPLVVLKRE